MHNNTLFLFIICLTCCLNACKTDVDFNNLDKQTEVDFGIGMPIGNISATFRDFLGSGLSKKTYIDQKNHKGILTYRDTFTITRNFHQIDLTRYMSTATQHFIFNSAITTNPIMGTGQQIVLKFPFSMRLSNINSDLNDERIDSVLINNAQFTNSFNTSNLALPFDWINRIELELGNTFRRQAGNKIAIYDCTTQYKKYNFGSDIPVDIDNFSMCFMKDRTQVGEVTDSVDFVLYLTITIPVGQPLVVSNDATFDYNLNIDFLDYEAIWGMFKPSKEMFDQSIFSIVDNWPGWKQLQQSKLPFTEPRIDAKVTTQIAGHLVLLGDYIYAKSYATNDSVFATFDEMGTHNYTHVIPDTNLLPLTSSTHESMVDVMYFTHETDKGHIDRLFTIHPDVIGYKFGIDFYNREKYKQGRLSKNTNVTVDAITTLPFIFNQGVEMRYTDTLMNISINAGSIDSLRQSLDTIKSMDIVLSLTAENTIPLVIKGTFRCFDIYGKELMVKDEYGNLKPFQLVEDTLFFDAPTFAKIDSTTIMKEAGKNTILISLDKNKCDALSNLNTIVFDAIVDDESVQLAQKKNPDIDIYPIKITEDSNLRIHITLATDVQAVVNSTKNANKDK